jgi:hypothetical protein
LPLADGRYLANREPDGESVLVVQTIAAPPRPVRRRRRPRDAEVAAPPAELPLARATAIRAFEPHEQEEGAAAWLSGATASEQAIDAVLATGIALLNDALHAQAVTSADPRATLAVAPERAVAVRLGYGSGEATAEGAFAAAREVDVAAAASPRRRRQEELRPQERVAAVLRGRERLAVCEPLLLRTRADLDAGRRREAALQLRIALDALLAELPEALDHADHRADIENLEGRREAVEATAERALTAELPAEDEASLAEALELAERVLRRRRVLGD